MHQQKTLLSIISISSPCEASTYSCMPFQCDPNCNHAICVRLALVQKTKYKPSRRHATLAAKNMMAVIREL